jgi:hypothetical protein
MERPVSTDRTAAGLRRLAQYVEEGRVPEDRFPDLPLRISVMAQSVASVSEFAEREGLVTQSSGTHDGGTDVTASLMLGAGVELLVSHLERGVPS